MTQGIEHLEVRARFAEALVDESQDALMALAVDGTVLFWNRGASNVFGYEPEEAVGRVIDELVVPVEHHEQARARRAESVAAGSVMFETVQRRKNGTEITVEISQRAVVDADGARFIAVNARDVSQITRLREEYAVEAQFRSLLEAAPDAMVIAGKDGRIIVVNGQTEKVFGYRRDELIGERVEKLVPERFRDSHPARRDSYLHDPKVRPMGAGLELRARRKDGTEFPVEISLSPLETKQGVLISSAIRDISDRKRAEERFRALLESAPDAMVIVGKDGRMVLVNAQMERLFGYRRDELLGQSIEMLVPSQYRDRHPGYRGRYFAAPTVRAMAGTANSLFGLRKDGSEFAAEISLSPIETPDGILATAAIRDISERKRLEELEQRRKNQELESENRRMQEANRLKSEFLANMSHELRTPLNAIIGFTELMFKGRVGPVSAPHKEYLGDILNSSKHLLQLINDVLDLAKVESGRMEFRPERLELAKVIGEVRDILRGLAAGKGIQLEVELDPSLEFVTLDPSKLKQVLYNYLSNALKFTPDRGNVTMRVTREGELYFRLAVLDTGIGIQPKDMSRLFIEFQQLDTGTAKKYAGTGLGLALTKRIVEAQGGRVEANSTVGVGSTFSAILPVRFATMVEVTPPRDAEPMTVERGEGHRALVLDDDPASLRLMETTLKQLGHEVACFDTARDALRAIDQWVPSMVVLALTLDGTLDFELLEQVRALRNMNGVPLLIWTVDDLTAAERARALEAAQGIVPKGEGSSEALAAILSTHVAAGRSKV
jgi:PAS domain S-box-containing protein